MHGYVSLRADSTMEALHGAGMHALLLAKLRLKETSACYADAVHRVTHRSKPLDSRMISPSSLHTSGSSLAKLPGDSGCLLGAACGTSVRLSACMCGQAALLW